MHAAEARIATGRASRYLVQLHRHADQMRRMPVRPPRAHGGAMPKVEHVEWSDTHGLIEFPWGRCTAEATEDTLTLHAEAGNEEDLRRIQEGIGRRLETIGRRDQLTLTWRPTEEPRPAPAHHGETATDHVAGPAPRRRRRHVTTIAIAVLAVLVIAVHLGLLGGVVATSQLAGWGVNLIVVLVLLKVIGIGSHFVLAGGVARHLGRRRKRLAKAGEEDR